MSARLMKNFAELKLLKSASPEMRKKIMKNCKKDSNVLSLRMRAKRFKRECSPEESAEEQTESIQTEAQETVF